MQATPKDYIIQSLASSREKDFAVTTYEDRKNGGLVSELLRILDLILHPRNLIAKTHLS